MLSISKEEAEITLQEILTINKATYEATSYQLEDGKGNQGEGDKSSQEGVKK